MARAAHAPKGGAAPGRAQLSFEEMKRLLDLSCSISAGLGVDEFRREVLDFVLSVLASDAANFFIANKDAKTLNLLNVLSHDIERRWLESFESYYHYLDPFLQAHARGFGVAVLDEIVDMDRFVRGEYYNDFLKPQRIHHEMALSLRVGGRCVGVIGLFRPKDKPKYTREEKDKAEFMLPYLANGLERAILFEHTRQKSWILEASLRGRGGPGILVLDAGMKLVFANDEAHRLLSSAPCERGGGLRLGGGCEIVLPEKLGALCVRMLRALARPEGPGSPTGETDWIDTEGRAVCARVSPLSGYFLGQREHFVVVRLGTRYGTSARLNPAIAERYRLTRREVDVVAEAIKGHGNTQIAENLFISVHTVENHLKRIFKKVGVRSRTELSYKLLGQDHPPSAAGA